jgi:anhydro-N-acetylmuramic acid kinase
LSVNTLYIGIMSGTSLDGADAVLVDFHAAPRVVGFASTPYPEELRATILELNRSGDDELHVAARASNDLAGIYAATVQSLLQRADVQAGAIRAIGCHGQTVRHRPDLGFTIQLQNPALLAELTSVTVVADFRSRDIAAGGQGAPLVPAFHESVFRQPERDRVIVNIGGISNITLLLRGQPASGFDCGPGNMLMDAWINRNLAQAFDIDGKWAASGEIIPSLLDALMADGYFSLEPPKSTGRDLFSLAWLEARISSSMRAKDIQATLLELTAVTIASGISRLAPSCAEIFLCGGGANNTALTRRLQGLLPSVQVQTTDALGIPVLQVEAVAFAWFAKQALDGCRTDLTQVTGSSHPTILGAIYPA